MSDTRHSSFWPLSVGLLALTILLGWQLNFTFQARINMGKQITAQKEAAEKAQKAQKEVEAIVNDVLAMAETEPAARVIVDKYQIRRNEGTPPAAK